MLTELPLDVFRTLLSFCGVEQLAKLTQTEQESSHSVKLFIAEACRKLCPPKKRVRRSLRGLAYLQSERHSTSDDVSLAKSLLADQSWQRYSCKELAKIPAGSLIVVDLSGSKCTLDACFVESNQSGKGGGSTVSVLSKRHRPLVNLRLDSSVQAVLTPVQQDLLDVPHHQYLDLVGKVGRVSWPHETRRPIRWVEELQNYSGAEEKLYRVQINRIFANVISGVEDTDNPFVQAHFLEDRTDQAFVKGSRVQTSHNNGTAWWHGTITEILPEELPNHKKRCQILYDDGSTEVSSILYERGVLIHVLLIISPHFHLQDADLPDPDVILEQAWSMFTLRELSFGDVADVAETENEVIDVEH
jgi:hypothetical protein